MQGCLQVQRHLPSKQLLREYYRVKEENTLISDNNRIASCATCALEAIHPKRAGASQAFLNRVTGFMYSNVRTQGIAEDVNLR